MKCEMSWSTSWIKNLLRLFGWFDFFSSPLRIIFMLTVMYNQMIMSSNIDLLSYFRRVGFGYWDVFSLKGSLSLAGFKKKIMMDLFLHVFLLFACVVICSALNSLGHRRLGKEIIWICRTHSQISVALISIGLERSIRVTRKLLCLSPVSPEHSTASS